MDDVTLTARQRLDSSPIRYGLLLLWRDKFAFASALFLSLVVVCALFGPSFFSQYAHDMNLRGRNAPPFSLENGWIFVLGADTLGRSILARIIVASQNTMAIAGSAVLCAMVLGGTLGLIAGFRGGLFGTVVLRLADILMSFPSLLLAIIVLYVFDPRVANVVLVLAITRIPIFLRTVRAETLEVRERMYVLAARSIGASQRRIIWRHLAPAVIPTLITVATLDFALVILNESSLSFLGIGIQPPEITWGLMVAEGRNYLGSAWWLSFWPGVAIMLTALSLNLLGGWIRTVTDPRQRWRLERPGDTRE